MTPAPSAAGPAETRRARLGAALAVAMWSVALLLADRAHDASYSSDFDQVWFGARALLAGRNPYSLIGPGREFDWVAPLYYPAPALVAAIPFGGLPLEWARCAFVAVSAGTLAYLVARQGWWRLLIFLSAPFYYAAVRAQWSPLVAAATLAPVLGFVVAIKPTVGLAVVAAQQSIRAQLVAVVGAVVLLGFSFWMEPEWVENWRAAIADSSHIRAPLTYWRAGGPLLTLALLRWRRPEARLLFALSCVPHSLFIYEALYFMLFPRTRVGMMLVALGSWIGYGAQSWVVTWMEARHLAGYVPGEVLVVCFYLPALVAVLVRPNEGQTPDWLTWLARRAPVIRAALREGG